MKLYIRHRSGIFINFLHSPEEFEEFENAYITGTNLVIGDLSTFNKAMKLKLLKFIEENPQVDCYSSEDLTDPVLASRFIDIIKEPLNLVISHSLQDFFDAKKDYTSSAQLLSGWSYSMQLRAPLMSKNLLKIADKL